MEDPKNGGLDEILFNITKEIIKFNKNNRIKFCDIHRGICQPDYFFLTQKGDFFW